MRALPSTVGLVAVLAGAAGVAGLVGVAGLAGCQFRPGGSPNLGDDDPGPDAAPSDGPTADAAQPVDARAIDAPPAFDQNTCPIEYRDMGDTPSRYRVIDADKWPDAQATCRSHSAGLTHLAVFSGDGERDAVGAYLFFVALDYRRLWLGTWHDGTAPRTVTGESLYPVVNMASNRAVSWERSLVTPFFVEALGTRNAALCECDGRPSTP